MDNQNLKYDAESYLSSSLLDRNVPVNESNQRHNDNTIANIQIEDLLYLERDLDFYEKVSLMFLCYGNERLRSAFALQQLQTGQYSTDTSFLTDWAINTQQSSADNNSDCWKSFLIEALCIIKAHHVLSKLGLNLPELYIHFLPQNFAISSYIHPVLKALYFICEQLTQSEANDLINKIESNNLNGSKIKFNENYLEVYMLKWLNDGIIAVGHWINNLPVRRRDVHCNVDCILQYFKELDKESLRSVLQSVQINMNFTSENRIKGGKCESSKKIAADEDSFMKLQISSACNNAAAPDENRNYQINPNNAGQVLIINQRDFYTTSNDSPVLEKRKGTDCDKRKLSETFAARGFKIYQKDNVASFDIIASIRELIAKQAQSFDSTAICILSHGNEGLVYGADSLPIKIDEIQKELCVESLINKPKILIIQACQGESMQKAYAVRNFIL